MAGCRTLIQCCLSWPAWSQFLDQRHLHCRLNSLTCISLILVLILALYFTFFNLPSEALSKLLPNLKKALNKCHRSTSWCPHLTVPTSQCHHLTLFPPHNVFLWYCVHSQCHHLMLFPLHSVTIWQCFHFTVSLSDSVSTSQYHMTLFPLHSATIWHCFYFTVL